MIKFKEFLIERVKEDCRAVLELPIEEFKNSHYEYEREIREIILSDGITKESMGKLDKFRGILKSHNYSSGEPKVKVYPINYSDIAAYILFNRTTPYIESLYNSFLIVESNEVKEASTKEEDKIKEDSRVERVNDSLHKIINPHRFTYKEWKSLIPGLKEYELDPKDINDIQVFTYGLAYLYAIYDSLLNQYNLLANSPNAIGVDVVKNRAVTSLDRTEFFNIEKGEYIVKYNGSKVTTIIETFLDVLSKQNEKLTELLAKELGSIESNNEDELNFSKLLGG